MNYLLTPHEELNKRIEILQRNLVKHHIDGALLTKNVEIFYYSGSMQNAIMFVPVEGNPTLFVKKSVERAEKETPFIVEAMSSIKQLPNQLKGNGFHLGKLGIELDVLPYNQFQRYQKVFADTTFVDISPITRFQRSIKSTYEIDLIRQSAEVVNQVIQKIPEIVKVGMTELELTAILEKLVRDKGHIGYMRTRAYNMELVLGMIASGRTAATSTSFDGPAGGEGLTPAFPQGSGWKKIEVNEPIIIDMAAVINGYIIDQTRIAVIGELDSELEHAYQISIKIKEITEEHAKPGTLWSEHYIRALEIVNEEGLQDYFMGYKEDQAKFLGHGVGLELDELPVLAKGLDNPLEEGMIIAIEPKFTYPNKGVIGIENTYVVREDGLESLSISSEDIIKIPIK